MQALPCLLGLGWTAFRAGPLAGTEPLVSIHMCPSPHPPHRTPPPSPQTLFCALCPSAPPPGLWCSPTGYTCTLNTKTACAPGESQALPSGARAPPLSQECTPLQRACLGEAHFAWAAAKPAPQPWLHTILWRRVAHAAAPLPMLHPCPTCADTYNSILGLGGTCTTCNSTPIDSGGNPTNPTDYTGGTRYTTYAGAAYCTVPFTDVNCVYSKHRRLPAASLPACLLARLVACPN